MNTNKEFPQPSENENNLELQGFMEHMIGKHVNIERDLLIHEISKKLKLNNDCRFQFFTKHCDQYKSQPFQEEVTHFSYSEYIERLRSIVDDIGKQELHSPDFKKLHSVIGMVHTLIIDCAIDDLQNTLNASFPEYFTSEVTES